LLAASTELHTAPKVYCTPMMLVSSSYVLPSSWKVFAVTLLSVSTQCSEGSAFVTPSIHGTRQGQPLARISPSVISTRDNHPRLSEANFRLDIVQGIKPTSSYSNATATIPNFSDVADMGGTLKVKEEVRTTGTNHPKQLY